MSYLKRYKTKSYIITQNEIPTVTINYVIKPWKEWSINICLLHTWPLIDLNYKCTYSPRSCVIVFPLFSDVPYLKSAEDRFWWWVSFQFAHLGLNTNTANKSLFIWHWLHNLAKEPWVLWHLIILRQNNVTRHKVSCYTWPILLLLELRQVLSYLKGLPCNRHA